MNFSNLTRSSFAPHPLPSARGAAHPIPSHLRAAQIRPPPSTGEGKRGAAHPPPPICAARDADTVDEIIAQLCGEGTPSPDPLDVIADTTIAVMTGVPEKREEWFGVVWQIQVQAGNWTTRRCSRC
jgi:hypothetical protein